MAIQTVPHSAAKMKPPCFLWLLVVSLLTLSSTAKKISLPNDDIRVDSSLGRHLLAHARPVEGTADRALDQYGDFSFISDYKIKFQGCHHVSQWNDDVDDEDDVRIMTKRLVRFRLCPSDSCANDKTAGCTSKYGDYAVDMSTFVYSYLEAMQDESICDEVATDCQQECGNDDDDCMATCYDAYEVSYCLNGDGTQQEGEHEKLDPIDYAECGQFDLGNNERRLNDGGVQYYVGPYCAQQGGEIHLGLFTDDTCTTFASSGESTFYDTMGYELPYSDDSLVSSRCMSCAQYDDDSASYVKDVCSTLYGLSGKCETKMSVDYPNESACTYIEGIKIIRADGVIRTSAIRKSKAAAVVIGLLLTFSVLLGAYVYYLRTKLARARINLVSATNVSGLT